MTVLVILVECQACLLEGHENTANWWRVSCTAERSQVDQRIGYHLHAIMPLLDTFTSEQEPLACVLPRTGPLDAHAQGNSRCESKRYLRPRANQAVIS